MKNSNTYFSDNFQKECIHSQICSVGNDDLAYRKAYKGDWGDWDDMPITATSNLNAFEVNENISVAGDATAYENSYL